MYGDAVDTLNLYAKANGQLGNPLWTRTGERGDEWVRGQIEVTVASSFQVCTFLCFVCLVLNVKLEDRTFCSISVYI